MTPLVFSVRTVSYGSSFFPLRFMARAIRAWAINRGGKNSVRNLRYGPRTRLVRGIYGLKIGKIEKTRFTQIEKKTWVQLKFHLNYSNCFRPPFTTRCYLFQVRCQELNIECARKYQYLQLSVPHFMQCPWSQNSVIIRFPVTGVITEYSHSFLVFSIIVGQLTLQRLTVTVIFTA